MAIAHILRNAPSSRKPNVYRVHKNRSLVRLMNQRNSVHVFFAACPSCFKIRFKYPGTRALVFSGGLFCLGFRVATVFIFISTMLNILRTCPVHFILLAWYFDNRPMLRNVIHVTFHCAVFSDFLLLHSTTIILLCTFLHSCLYFSFIGYCTAVTGDSFNDCVASHVTVIQE